MQLQTNFFPLVLISLLLIDTVPWSLCSLSRRSHNSTSFVECQLASRPKSAANHTLILEEIQIEFSSHFTSLPYEITIKAKIFVSIVVTCAHFILVLAAGKCVWWWSVSRTVEESSSHSLPPVFLGSPQLPGRYSLVLLQLRDPRATWPTGGCLQPLPGPIPLRMSLF